MRAFLGRPLLVALTYLVLGLTYIATSDWLLTQFLSDPRAITSVQTAKGWAYVGLTATLLYWFAILQFQRRESIRRRLRRTHANFDRMLDSAVAGRWIVNSSGAIVRTNTALQNMLGLTGAEILALGSDRLVEPESPRAPRPSETPRADSGSADTPVAVTYVSRTPGMDRARRFGMLTSIELLDAESDDSLRVFILIDTTALREAQESLASALDRERRLRAELDHRVRNNLASLLTLIDVARSRTDTVEEFASQIRGLVGAIASVHSLLASTRTMNASLGDLVASLVPHWRNEGVHFHGPAVPLHHEQAPPLGMILEELHTNARSHGSLRKPDGVVTISWRLEDAGTGRRDVLLDWIERDGPPIEMVSKGGLGLSIVRGLAESDLRGQLSVTFPREGARVSVRFPLKADNGTSSIADRSADAESNHR
ncbi:MAG: sensor histidine kinase [Phycisphaerales bacterium]